MEVPLTTLFVDTSTAHIVERCLARGIQDLMQTAGRQMRPAMAKPHLEVAQKIEDLRMSIEEFLRDCGEWDT